MVAEKKILDTLKEIWPLFPAAIFLVSFLLLVLLFLVNLAFTYEGAFPSFQILENTFADHQFQEALLNTFVFMLIGTPMELFVGFFLAMLVFRAFGCKSFIRSVFTIPFALPGLVIATLLAILFSSEGGFVNHVFRGKYFFFPEVVDKDIAWRSTKSLALGLSLMGKVWRDMPISMLIILSGLNSIDPTVLDAAKTLGAGFRVRLLKIILPLTFPAITTVLLLRSIEMWKEFIFPHVLARNYNLLGTLIDKLYSTRIDEYGISQASLVALVLVVCIVVTLYVLFLVLKLIRNWMVDGTVYARK